MPSQFSVLMSVYDGENPLYLQASLMSLAHSTYVPSEVVLVEDGPINNKLQMVILKSRDFLTIKSVCLPENIGLPGALNEGLGACAHELIARFDTDDICASDRFEKQLMFMKDNPAVAAISSTIEEFDSVTGARLKRRSPPICHEDLLKRAKISSPLNHPAVMFRRSLVLSVGGYPIKLTRAFEDYALWIKLLVAGYKLANLPDVLVYMRAGYAQSFRRSGFSYAQEEFNFAKFLLRIGFLNYYEFIRFLCVRIPFRFMPKRMIALAYGCFARN